MSKGSPDHQRGFSSPFMGCLALLLIFFIHALLLTQSIGISGPVGVNVATALLVTLFLPASLKFASLLVVAGRTSHAASRRYDLIVYSSSAIGCLLAFLGVLLWYAVFAEWLTPGWYTTAILLKIAGLASLWFAATLTAPITSQELVSKNPCQQS